MNQPVAHPEIKCRMLNILTKFISNKTNLMIIQCILYFLIGYTIMDLTTKQQIFIVVTVLCVSILNHLIGVSKGIFIATIHREELDTFMKILDEQEQNGENNNEKDIN